MMMEGQFVMYLWWGRTVQLLNRRLFGGAYFLIVRVYKGLTCLSIIEQVLLLDLVIFLR